MSTIPDFDPNQISTELSDKALSIMNMFKDNIFIIEKYSQREEEYDAFINVLLINIKFGFEHREFRDYPVQFKFNDDEDEQVKFLPFRHFIINVMMWRPQVIIDFENIGNELIISSSEMTKLSNKFIKNYFDTYYVERYNRKISNHRMNEILCDTRKWLSTISMKFNMIMGLSINIEIFIDLAKRIPEFNDLIHFKLDESMQPNDIETTVKSNAARQVELIMRDNEFNVLKPMLQPGSGFKAEKLSELIGTVGLKPDIEGRTIPKPINGNFLTGVLRSVENYYKNAISGVKAAIMNNEFMGKTGHFAILVSIVCAQVKLSKTVSDCNTLNPIEITINSAEHLRRLDGRRYRFHGSREYNIINSKKDTHLIGKTVLIRSTITCAAPDGVCKECYGELFYTNKDNHSVGIFSATTITNPLVQGILSAKHYQTTESNKIEFGEEFDKFFYLYSTEILIKSDVDELFKYSLIIRKEELSNNEDIDEDDNQFGSDDDDDDNTSTKKKKASKEEEDDDINDDDSNMETKLTFSTKKFEVWKNFNDKTGSVDEKIVIEDVDKKELFMHRDFLMKMSPGQDKRGKFLYVSMENLNPEEFLFMIDVHNNELTKPLRAIEKLLNTKDREGCINYEDMTQKMLDLLIESRIEAQSVHGELILRQLVRKKSNILKRPDFSRLVTLNDYQLLTIKTALKKNPSIITSISTPYLKDQLVNMVETWEKDASSDLDLLFKKELSEDV